MSNCGGGFDVDSKQKRVEESNQVTARPDFWNDADESLDEVGLSATGHADQARLILTARGLVAAWLDNSSGVTQVYGKVFTAGQWLEWEPGSASGGGLSSSATDVRELAIASAGDALDLAWVADTADGVGNLFIRSLGGTASPQVYHHPTLHDVATPSLAYHDGHLFAAWPGH